MSFTAKVGRALKLRRYQTLVAVLGLVLGSLAIYLGVMSTAMGEVEFQCLPFIEGEPFDRQLYFKRMRDLRTDREIETYTINRSPPVEVYIFKMPAMLGRGAACEIRVAAKLITSVRKYAY